MSIKLDQHDELIIEQLKDVNFAATYLNEHLEFTGRGRRQHILHAIQLISIAQGVSKVAKESGLKKLF
jgi:DNA-binding phage protein